MQMKFFYNLLFHLLFMINIKALNMCKCQYCVKRNEIYDFHGVLIHVF